MPWLWNVQGFVQHLRRLRYWNGKINLVLFLASRLLIYETSLILICTPMLFGHERGEMAEDDDDLHWITGKLERTLERMRRAAVKMIDRTAPSIGDTDEGRECVCALLVAVIDILGASLQAASLFSPCLCQMLKIYLCRAETNPGLVDPIPGYSFCPCENWLNIANPRTHDTAYDHLECAVVILRIGEDVDPKPSESGSADILT